MAVEFFLDSFSICTFRKLVVHALLPMMMMVIIILEGILHREKEGKEKGKQNHRVKTVL